MKKALLVGVLVVGLAILGAIGLLTPWMALAGVGGGEGTPSGFKAFLKIEGIAGESADEKHKNEIEILSFGWGEEAPVTGFAEKITGTDKVSKHDFQFTMKISKASPKLFLAAARGQRIKEATLTVIDKSGQEYLQWKLGDITVSSYKTGGDATKDASPIDTLKLSFNKIKVEYSEILPDGSLGPPIKAGWDLKENRGIQ